MAQPVQMNPLAQQIHAVVARYSSFAQPIVVAQCKFIKKTPETITREDLPRLASYIGKAVALFSNPEKGRELEKAISEL